MLGYIVFKEVRSRCTWSSVQKKMNAVGAFSKRVVIRSVLRVASRRPIGESLFRFHLEGVMYGKPRY